MVLVILMSSVWTDGYPDFSCIGWPLYS